MTRLTHFLFDSGGVRTNTKCHRAQPHKNPQPTSSFSTLSSSSSSSSPVLSVRCSSMFGGGGGKPSNEVMNSMVATCIDLLTSSCSRLVWILLVLVSIPVGPHNQVLFIHSQSLTRQWSTRVVSTKQGLTRGFLFLPRGHEGVEVFLGIPYASPPLGSLRLMPPVSGSPWTGIKTNEQPPPVCPQVLPWGLGSPESANLTEDEEALKWMPRGRLSQLKRLFPFLSNQSEDCLYLNIYVPLSVADGREDKVLPVLVFIHGEDFGYGAGNPYDPSMLVSQGNLIAVTLNYRLGILGFLNANSDGYFKSPANFALLDQIAALHWVQENIAAFGGDVKRISLMGQGKGAAFVNFLMISNALPKELLFHRVILMSGSALSPLAVGLSNGKDLAKKFAARVKCPTEPPSNMLQCLRQIPLQYFLRSELWRYFGPSDDGVVIEHGIRENILRDKLSHYPMLFGVTRAEILPTLGEHDAVYGLETEKRREVLKQLVDGFYSLHRGEILAAAIHEYTDWERPVQHPISVRDETLDALADAQIVSPLVKVGELHSQGNSQTYLYVFEYQSKISDYTQRLGCVPGEDLVYVFGVPLYISWNDFAAAHQLSSSSSASEQHWSNNKAGSGGSSSSSYGPIGSNIGSGSVSESEPEQMKLGFFTGNFTRNEVQLSLTLVHYWANFIRAGNPNAESPEGSPHGFGPSGSKGGSSEAGSSGGGTGTSMTSMIAGGNRYPPSPQLSTTLQQQQQHNQDKFAKPKLIDWPPYDTLFKKYLSIEAKPRVRNHYRAHKLSFWLHLVPELMRNGYYNSGFPLGSTGIPSRSNNNNHNLPFNGNFTTPHSPTIEFVGPWEQKPYYYVESNSSYPGDISGPLLYPPGRHPYYHDHHHDGEGYQIYSTALTVTIAVGCSLLILNILVFAAFYYYRDKRRSNRESRGRREGEGNYGHHQQTPLTGLSNTGPSSGDNTVAVSGGGPEASLSTMDLQMQEISASMAGGVGVGQAHPTYVESSAAGTNRHQQQQHMMSGYADNSSSSSNHPTSLQNTPVRFPPQHQHHQQQQHHGQLKENGQILNLRHHLQQPQLQMPIMPMPNICGDLSSVPNLQQLLQSAQDCSRMPHNVQAHHQQQQQYLQPHQQQQHQGQTSNTSTLPGPLPRKHQKGSSSMNLTNLDFSMPDAILAAAMMLNYRQPPSSSTSATDHLLPGTMHRQKAGTAPRKSALNMKEQLLISAGIIGSSGGGGASSTNVASLGRTGGVGISASTSPSLGGAIFTTASKPPGTSGPNISVSSSSGGGVCSVNACNTATSGCAGGSVANVIQFDMENSGTTTSASGKTVPRPPKRHTPTVKFSPDTFQANNAGGENASPELQHQQIGVNFTGSNVTLSSATTTTGSPGNAPNIPTANTNVTTINQTSAPGGQTLKSSLKKNSSYSASGMSEELKV